MSDKTDPSVTPEWLERMASEAAGFAERFQHNPSYAVLREAREWLRLALDLTLSAAELRRSVAPPEVLPRPIVPGDAQPGDLLWDLDGGDLVDTRGGTPLVHVGGPDEASEWMWPGGERVDVSSPGESRETLLACTRLVLLARGVPRTRDVIVATARAAAPAARQVAARSWGPR